MTSVFILMEERNVNARPDDGSAEAWVDSVYSSEAKAKAAQQARIAAAKEEGMKVYGEPDDDEDEDEWDVDFTVTEHVLDPKPNELAPPPKR